jgi:tetratricopeptide (TPR) repeat protein
MARYTLLAVLVVLLAACADRSDQQAVASPAPEVELYTDLGNHGYAITAASPEVQQYFDQGLRLMWAFNHAEAIRAFNEAARLDPNCAMCYWGVAYSYGPNINAPMDSASGVAAYEAVQRAQQLTAQATDVERALIDALARRYAATPPADRAVLDSAYATAMVDVRRRFPADQEVASLSAEALMDLSPWYYWNADGTPRPATPDIISSLEQVIQDNPNHPGACHLYIHAVEAVEPEKAVPCAERLAGLMPGAGHLVHMPGHIYIRVGRYMDAITANEHAVHADETYIRDQQPALGTYLVGYYPHNYDFLAFAASMAGRQQQAVESAQKVESLVPAEMLVPGAGPLEHFSTVALRTMVRFGRWDEILQRPQPAEGLTYARGIWHYAQGMARSARGELDQADAELAAVRSAAAEPTLAEVVVGFNSAAAVLTVASHVLAGEIAAKRGNLTEAIAHLEQGASAEDDFIYGEPPDWPVPVRQHLGAVLLQAGRAADAERVYREDLGRFPENGWSLFGLAEALKAQGKTAEAAEVERRLAAAWTGSDVTLTASRF